MDALYCIYDMIIFATQPRGSILDPLFFLVYIDDLLAGSKVFMPILFEDDTDLFIFHWVIVDSICLTNKPGNQNNLFMGKGKQIISKYC